MSMTKRGLILAALLLASPFAFAQIRDYVPIVRPVYGPPTVAFFTSLSGSLRWLGYDDLAELFKAYAAGGHGSGFVVVAPDGTNYVVTNYHVVAGAGVASLEFEKEKGSSVVYKDCPVLAWEEALDLALIAFPAGERPFASGLLFSDRSAEDGLDVWTAGYPGANSKPLWQLGRGNITNAAARVEELVDPAVTALIQHSGQVDAGNSGGPLLITARGRPGGYQVLGVNTWKIAGRQAANFSVPAAAVRSFIERARAAGGRAADIGPAALEKRGREFEAALAAADKPHRKLMEFISLDCVLAEGEAALKDVLSRAPASVCREILDCFAGFSAFRGLRLAIAYRLSSVLKNADGKTPVFAAVDQETAAGRAPVRFQTGDKEVTSTWVREAGAWRLASFPLPGGPATSAADEPPALRIETPYNFLITAGAGLNFDRFTTPTWSASVLFKSAEILVFGLELGFRSVTDETYGSGPTLVISAGLDTRLQLPLRFTSFAIIPSAGVCIGMNFGGGGMSLTPESMFGQFLAGLQICFGEEPFFSLGAAYKIDLGLFFDDGGSRLCLYAAVCL